MLTTETPKDCLGANLSLHFSKQEFEQSDTAARKCIDNTIPDCLLIEAASTAEFMEGIRLHLSSVKGAAVPLVITSAYRCPELNTAIGSLVTSDHTKMLAVDFKAPSFGTAYDVSKELSKVTEILGINQLIYEYGSWVHVSRKLPSKLINKIITINSTGTHVGIER